MNPPWCSLSLMMALASMTTAATTAAKGECPDGVCSATAQENVLLQMAHRRSGGSSDRSGSRSMTTSSSKEGSSINICYFTNWARYRSGSINSGKDLFELGVDGDLCTHYMYGFATVKQSGSSYILESNDPNADHPSGDGGQDGLCPERCNNPSYKVDWNDPLSLPCEWPCSPSRTYRGYEGLNVGMKRLNPDIQSLVSVGGWNFNDCAASSHATHGQGEATCEIFSTIANDEQMTREFARNVIAFCRKWGFDGFDLDWEYPVAAGHNDKHNLNDKVDRDYANYITMLRVMREEFHAENHATKPALLLTAAVGVGLSTAETAYNISGMNMYLDLINLMTYDLHGSWEMRTGCNANLYATDEDAAFGGGVGAGAALTDYRLSVSWAIDYWIEKGASPSKLTLGLGTYGRGWKLENAAVHGYNAPAVEACAAGHATKSAGFLAYYEIEELLQSNAATYYYDEERECPYIVTNIGDWIGYDNERSIRAKLAYARSKGLAGTMIWALDLDDFTGALSGGVKFPLISLAATMGTDAATNQGGNGAASTTAPATVTNAPVATTNVPASVETTTGAPPMSPTNTAAATTVAATSAASASTSTATAASTTTAPSTSPTTSQVSTLESTSFASSTSASSTSEHSSDTTTGQQSSTATTATAGTTGGGGGPAPTGPDSCIQNPTGPWKDVPLGQWCRDNHVACPPSHCMRVTSR